MLKRFIACLTIFVMSFSCFAFAAEKPSDQLDPQTDGYTYWKLEETKTGTFNGTEKILHQGPGGDKYTETVSFSFTETISPSVSADIKKTVEAALEVALGINVSRTKTISGTFGGTNFDPEKNYELRAWLVYDVYTVKGKEYYRVDGYEVATGNTFGYSDDDGPARTVKKYRTIAHRGDFEV